MENDQETCEALFEKALSIAESHLESAMKENEELSDYVAVAMIEASVNRATELTSPEDIADMLRDLADQIEESGEEGGEEGDEPKGGCGDSCGCDHKKH